MERMTVKYVIDGKDYVTLPLYEMLEDKYKQLEEENKKLKSDLMQDMKEITELEIENKKLKAELSKYKKQYQHSMGFMEEDTLQELRDIGEI